MPCPTLDTKRLLLRPFTPADANDVQLLAGDKAIAATTSHIPHPYLDGMAQSWIASHEASFDARESVVFAVVLKATDSLIGAVSLLNIAPDHRRGEIGYWLGVKYWGQGYCTEAARAARDFGFSVFDLNRIHGRCLKRNPASSRVMEKIGLRYEGCQRSHDVKWGQAEDVLLYGMLKSEWQPS